MKSRIALIVAFLALSISLVGNVTVYVSRAIVVEENCTQIETLKDSARVQLNRSLNTLPTLAYYKAHPDELKQQLANTRQYIRDLEARDCHTSWLPWGG